ncbi:MAG TPA: hypothetical protein PKI32_03065 [Opitutales bacterium]|nr:hypothetical protein [Opitutales bacterium]
MPSDSYQGENLWKTCPDPKLWTHIIIPPLYDFPITPDGYLIKSDEAPLNECAAYQLADFLEVPVPNHFFFLLPYEFLVQKLSPIGSLCIAIEKLPITTDTGCIEKIAKHDPHLAAVFLAFSCFDRSHDLSHAILINDNFVLIDFEGQFPHYPSEGKDVASTLNGYKAYEENTYAECFGYAEQVEIVSGFHKELVIACKKILGADFRPSFGPHPDADSLSNFFQKAIAQRASFLLKKCKDSICPSNCQSGSSDLRLDTIEPV